jgi:tRNA(His) guanylyltransferase
VLSVKDRVQGYSQISQNRLLPKLPIITIINGRGFSRITSLLDKPYSSELAQCLYSALLTLMGEIDGAVFGYSFSDQIIIISRNDQTLETQPWLNNDAQKISSITASIATLQFNNYAASIDLSIMGDATFYSEVFVVPSITEAINVLVAKQQDCFQSSVYQACFFELLKKHDRNDIRNMLSGTTIDEKTNLLSQECSIDFADYPLAFRRGVACYRAPKVVLYEGKEEIKHKFVLNSELPIFTKEFGFLGSIFQNGMDILRKG